MVNIGRPGRTLQIGRQSVWCGAGSQPAAPALLPVLVQKVLGGAAAGLVLVALLAA